MGHYYSLSPCWSGLTIAWTNVAGYPGFLSNLREAELMQ